MDNSCFIGNIYRNVQPIVDTDPDYVTITSSGRLGRGNVSSRRYKHDIKSMGEANNVLFALKPVSLRYNKEYGTTQTTTFGLIAEEVAEVAPDLPDAIQRGSPNRSATTRSTPCCLTSSLKSIARYGNNNKKSTLKAELTEQRELIQKIGDRLEITNGPPQM